MSTFIKIKEFITKPPVAFPPVALFHIVCVLMAITTLMQEPGRSTWINAAWMLGYTTFWVAATAMKKWGALGYILITIVNVIIHYSIHDHAQLELYGSTFYLIDIVFCFFLLVYYRKLN